MTDKEFYLYIDGRRVKVSEEVYLVYRHMEDRERYFTKTLKLGRTIVDYEKRRLHTSRGGRFLMKSFWKGTGSSRPRRKQPVKPQ